MGDEEHARCFRCFENYVNLSFPFILEKRFFLKSESSPTITATNNQSMKFVAKYKISPRDYQLADFKFLIVLVLISLVSRESRSVRRTTMNIEID